MSKDIDNGSNLAAINSATLGVEMPQITLKDGTKVQTGTAGALLINIREYNEAYKTGYVDKLVWIEEAMRATLPLLDKVGMFDLFPPEEWIQGDNEGRRVVGKLYQQFKSEQK